MIKMEFKLDQSGFKELNKFKKKIKSLEESTAEYGYFDGKDYTTEWSRDNYFTEAGLMYLLTFGTDSAGNGSSIPGRNIFLAAGLSFISENKKELGNIAKRLLEGLAINGKISDSELIRAGRILRKYTQSKFGESGDVGGVSITPNKESWARTKGRNAPLLNTGTLRDAMTERVSKGDIQ